MTYVNPWFVPIPAEGWAEPPQSLGEVIADELYRICIGRDMDEPIKLVSDEREQMVRAVREWLAGE